MTIKLTGNYIPNINPDSEIQEITINSPLGKALYLRMINDNNIKYIVNDKAIMINIIEKIPNEE